MSGLASGELAICSSLPTPSKVPCSSGATAEADLARWTALLESGDLTPADFTWLVQGKRDLSEVEALE